MACQEAICRIRIKKSASKKDEVQDVLDEELISSQPYHDDNSILALEKEPLLQLSECSEIPFETRLQWVRLISEQVLSRKKLDDGHGIRDWDFILSIDGSVDNLADNTLPPSSTKRMYPAEYRIPSQIVDRLGSDSEKFQRAELFALGTILYQVLSGKETFGDSSNGDMDEHLQSGLVKGEFPEDVWELPHAVRILGCWCPGFAKDLLAARSNDETLRTKVASYIKKHPIIFGFQVAGSIASLASLVALPVLGLVGFGAAGPVAGSAAAAWQSGIGLVEAGSIFAWCQSAAMGGAAVGGILATGLAGAGVAVGAAITGALDDLKVPAPDLKEKFLIAWKRDVGEA